MSEDADGAPRRLHPFAPVLTILRNAPSNVAGLLAAGAVAFQSIEWASPAVVIALAAAGGAIWLLFAWLAWRRFTYRVSADELVIERGIVSRHRRSIPRERVQDVAIEQGLLARMLGLARVRFETGGSETDEGLLECVSLEEARRLRTVVRGGAPRQRTASATEEEEPEERLLYRLAPGRLLLFGLLSFSMLWVAALFGAVELFGGTFGAEIADLADWVEDSEAELRARITVQVVLGLVALAVVLGVLSGLARTVVRDFGFRLTSAEGRLRRVAGLVRRSETVVAIRRIQLGLVRRGGLTGAFGWGALAVQTLGGSNDASGRQRLAPFARREEIAALMAEAGLPAFERLALRPVSWRHVPRAMVHHVLLPALALGAAVFFFPPAWPILFLLPFLLGGALLGRRFHRYGLLPESFQVARGVLAQQDWVVPYGRIQTVTVRQGPLQRLLGVATVGVDTAGAAGLLRPDVTDVAEADAVALARELIERV